MKSELLSLPGYKICEYLLVLQPNVDLMGKIMDVRNEFCKKYKIESAKWNKPHITLVKFSQMKMMEDRLINRLKMIALSQPEFKVSLKDFGSLPTHTIFINIESKASVLHLIKTLKSAQALLKTQEIKAHFIENPQLSIATKLLPWQYEQGWLEYSHQHFSAAFIAKSMLLLRRTEGSKSFQTVDCFEFMNIPVLTKQGVLF